MISQGKSPFEGCSFEEYGTGFYSKVVKVHGSYPIVYRFNTSPYEVITFGKVLTNLCLSPQEYIWVPGQHL